MAQETGVERLDYSKPPPGYRIDEQDGEWEWSVGDEVNPEDGNANLITTRPDALAAAWGHYKLQLEVERIGRVKAASPETLHLALSEADGELERLRKVLHDVRDDFDEGAISSAQARLEDVLG